ncbi:putative galactosylceramide sulfotransferase-like [Apostichopus japonicus]|uniref:Putative galactosylceramide sulfotransferase-like n=1 Tax=Stichopus japonicus TaxID=307972 RepID=A0A2G8JFX8_STIJA|nr:putative galactosylceramide sulfotransferase-like [Apostichopus japonicus]
MSSVMPKDTIWTTIIRDPVDMFESTFYYRSLGGSFKIGTRDPLATFAGNPSYYINKYGHLTLARDPMMFDLGLTNDQKGNVKAIEKLISHLDDSFDLVLITEYFEESLILLRDLMCWQTDDIVSFVVNARAKSSVHEIRKDVRRRLWEWNSGDAMLYDHFNKTFWRKVEAYGVEKMRKEVVLLKARNRELNDKCILDPDKTVNQGVYGTPRASTSRDWY